MTSVTANIPHVIAIDASVDDTLDHVKVWTVNVGVYGLPATVGAKFPPSATVSAVYQRIQQFLIQTCGMAADQLSHNQANVAGITKQGPSISWLPTLGNLSIEGDIIPYGEMPLANFLKHGVLIQGQVNLRQQVQARICSVM